MNKRHYEHTLPNIRGSLSNTYSRSFIGYNYKGQHYYMSWLGVSANFPELMDVR